MLFYDNLFAVINNIKWLKRFWWRPLDVFSVKIKYTIVTVAEYISFLRPITYNTIKMSANSTESLEFTLRSTNDY